MLRDDVCKYLSIADQTVSTGGWTKYFHGMGDLIKQAKKNNDYDSLAGLLEELKKYARIVEGNLLIIK